LRSTETEAQALLRGDRSVAMGLAKRPLRPLPDNFVKRPWGGTALTEFKGLGASARTDEAPVGEAFEIAAFDADAEARAHPSRLRLEDGSEISLARLLALHGRDILGAEFVARFGACYPLLPKTLDVKELLSVQAHPPGHTEVYVIIAAERGASIRLGFAEDVDADALQAELAAGLTQQRNLLRLLGADIDQTALQGLLQTWLAARGTEPAALHESLAREAGAADIRGVEPVLAALKRCYWSMLDRMNEIPVRAGQVIHNATPARLLTAEGRPASAEVHALGNPERRELLALEIRKPGPTLRAWDNVRFPPRTVDVAAALDALNLRRTEPGEFFVEPEPVSGRAGLSVSVDSAHYRIEHCEPSAGGAVQIPAEPPHSLHVLAGAVRLYDAAGEALIGLARGESALVPQGVGAYRIEAESTGAQVVKAGLGRAR
jgi:mannose-6-phosphate isomerase class I